MQIRLKRGNRLIFARSPGQNDVHYIPGFLSDEEAVDLLARIDEMPASSWTDLKRRRLQNHGGTPHPDGNSLLVSVAVVFALAPTPSFAFVCTGMLEEPVPKFIEQIFGLLVETGIFPEDGPPNHVLINSYKCGQGIAPHQVL
jgi:hypothetical protein